MVMRRSRPRPAGRWRHRGSPAREPRREGGRSESSSASTRLRRRRDTRRRLSDGRRGGISTRGTDARMAMGIEQGPSPRFGDHATIWGRFHDLGDLGPRAARPTYAQRREPSAVALCQLNRWSATSAATPSGSSRPRRRRGSRRGRGGFPELAITGYPPEDLLLKPGFVADNLAALGEGGRRDRAGARPWWASSTPDSTCTTPPRSAQGEVRGVYHKQELPNYGVFDEQRYFAPGGARPSSSASAGCGWGVDLRRRLEPAGPHRQPRPPPAPSW